MKVCCGVDPRLERRRRWLHNGAAHPLQQRLLHASRPSGAPGTREDDHHALLTGPGQLSRASVRVTPRRDRSGAAVRPNFDACPCGRCHAHSPRFRRLRGVAPGQQLLARQAGHARHRPGGRAHRGCGACSGRACGGAQATGVRHGGARPDGRADRAVSRSAGGAGADGRHVSGRCRRGGGMGQGQSRRQRRCRGAAGGQPALGSQRAVAGGVPAGAGHARTGSTVGAAPG